MKILLTTLNSKYIHSNLAIRYLKGVCSSNGYPDILIKEFSINDNIERVIGAIFREKPDVIGFSCYIWNIRETLMVVDTLKKVLPSCKIILGGPEVSFDSVPLMEANMAVDFVVRGEGEKTFVELIRGLKGLEDLRMIYGLTYREGQRIIENPDRLLITNLDTIPFPYKDGFEDLDNRMIYYETSRGCPFNCQYCLSSTIKGVRFFSLNRVKRDLQRFIEAGVPQVKLVDRTFNCNPERAREIFRFIINMKGRTNFHFEMSGDLIDGEMMAILKEAPPGLFQFEVGVQSIRGETLKAIQRNTDLDQLAKNIEAIGEKRNIHLHVDLIAGLPKEDYQSFSDSFNYVYGLNPDRIQLGFLKLLKGSGLREDAEKYGYKFISYPPYEVLENKYISYNELLDLKGIEDLVEKYCNSHRFDSTLNYLITLFEGNPFMFFERFMKYWKQNNYHSVSHGLIRLYEILLHFGNSVSGSNKKLLAELLRFDYVSQEKPVRYPQGLEPTITRQMQSKVYDFFKNETNIHKYLPHMSQYTGKQISRMAHIEVFKYDITDKITKGEYPEKETVILFDYKLPNKVFFRSKWTKISLH